MNRYLIIAILMVLGVCKVKGQTSDIHVYLRNGEVHSFFYERADSITFDGADKQNIWTVDSAYSVDISEIDSVSFGSRTLPIAIYDEDFAGWSDVMFCNNGIVAFHADKTENEPEKSLMFLPDEDYGVICSYAKYDENSYPYVITFNDDVYYISEDDEGNPLYTVVQGDSLVLQIGGIYSEVSEARNIARRSWKENNWVRNGVAACKVIVGTAQAVGSGFLIKGSLATGGPTNPISAYGLAVGAIGFKGGADMVQSGLDTMFVPAAKSSKGVDNYGWQALGNGGWKAISEGLSRGACRPFLLENLPKDAIKYLADAPQESKLTSWTFWGQMTLEALDAKFGETITKADKIAAIYDKGNVNTGVAKDITPNSALVRGYISPELTYGLDNKNVDVEYGLIVKGNGDNYTKKISGEHGGQIEFELENLSPSCEYTYFAYLWNQTDVILRFGSQENFKTPALPVASTGNHSDVTTSSASVSCTYENVPENGTCGVEFTWDGGSLRQTANSVNGTQKIELHGLKPGTAYTYCAYIDAFGQTHHGADSTFTTKYDVPNISGVWNCTEYQDGEKKGEGTFTLNADGTVTRSDLSGSCGELGSSQGLWTINADGNVRIYFEYVSNSGASEKTYDGTINSFANPTKIEGDATYSYTGNVFGGTRREYRFVMTR